MPVLRLREEEEEEEELEGVLEGGMASCDVSSKARVETLVVHAGVGCRV